MVKGVKDTGPKERLRSGNGESQPKPLESISEEDLSNDEIGTPIRYQVDRDRRKIGMFKRSQTYDKKRSKIFKEDDQIETERKLLSDKKESTVKSSDKTPLRSYVTIKDKSGAYSELEKE